jgi:hypothetical protein
MNWILLARAAFFICLGGFGLFSAVLIYHWHRYGRGAWFIAVFELVHLGVGVFLLGTALLLLLQL